MALITCPECEGKLSTTAPACPHCGWVQGTAAAPLTPAEPAPPAEGPGPDPTLPPPAAAAGPAATPPPASAPAPAGTTLRQVSGGRGCLALVGLLMLFGMVGASQPVAGLLLAVVAVVLALRALGRSGRRSVLSWLLGVRAPGWNGTRGVALLELALLGLVVSLGVTAAYASWEQERRSEEQAAARAAAKRAEEQRLRGAAPALAAELRGELEGLPETGPASQAVSLDE